MNPNATSLRIDFHRGDSLDDLAKLAPGALDLSFATSDIELDVPALADRFPQLKKLTLCAPNIRGKRLHDAIARFKSLEELTLDDCGITGLPAALTKLRLKKLTLNRLPIHAFPELICQIRSLESLSVSGVQWARLPDAMSQLTVLRELRLDGVLDTGDVPKVVGSLIRLERLVLARCGIRDSENLADVFSKLPRLKRLDLSHAVITSVEFLTPCVALESLDLGWVKTLKTLEGIELLPRLEHLNLEHSRVPSLEPLKRAAALSVLNIEHLECDDASALFDIDVELIAEKELVKKYKTRALDSFEELLAQLASSQAATSAQLEPILAALAARSAVESAEESALLQALNVDAGAAAVAVPSLEAVVTPHLGTLNPLVLAKLFAALYPRVEVNLPLAARLAREVATRGGADAQLTLIDAFKHANASYEPGHRPLAGTVHDVLIEAVLPLMGVPALMALLTWASDSALELDRLDALFAPALEKADEPQRQLLIARMSGYLVSRIEVPEVAQTVLEALEQSSSPEVREAVAPLRAQLEAERAEVAMLAQLKTDFESGDVARVGRAIEALVTLSEHDALALRGSVQQATGVRGLAVDSSILLMRWLQQNNEPGLELSFLSAAVTHGIDAMRPVAIALSLSDTRLAKFLRAVVAVGGALATSDDDLITPVTLVQLKGWAASLS